MAGLLRIRGARQLVQVCKNGEKVLKGAAQSDLAVLTAGERSGLSVVVDNNGIIAAIGTDSDVDAHYSHWKFDKEVDATGRCVIPGLVDAHTHPVFDGDRSHEFAMKLAGATYMEIHEKGGGIHFTVQHTRRASPEQLYDSLTKRLWEMLQCGTTTVEAKSGYGLDTESEVKMLKVIDRARKNHPIGISSTYCGAHAIPQGRTAEETTEDILNDQIPVISKLCQSGELGVDNIDVFCEKGVFSTEQSHHILAAGKKVGWNVNFHGDELHSMNSGELAEKVGAHCVSHLEEVTDAGIAAMSRANVVAVLLPTTQYILRIKCPPARKLIEKGVPVALGSDFNPNAYCLSLPLVMHLACCNWRMSMEEALVAATINSAAALGISEKCGSIEVGKKADLLVIDAPSWEHLIYQLGLHNHLIALVIKDGKVVHSRP